MFPSSTLNSRKHRNRDHLGSFGRLVNIISRGGNEKCGIYRLALTFLSRLLKERYGALSILITNFRGNRFNIIFVNGTFIYCLRDLLKELLDINNSNQLLKAEMTSS